MPRSTSSVIFSRQVQEQQRQTIHYYWLSPNNISKIILQVLSPQQCHLNASLEFN